MLRRLSNHIDDSVAVVVWNVDMDTTADVFANGAGAVSVDVNIDPWVYMAGVGFRF